jgi:hypothetical protein
MQLADRQPPIAGGKSAVAEVGNWRIGYCLFFHRFATCRAGFRRFVKWILWFQSAQKVLAELLRFRRQLALLAATVTPDALAI